MRFKDNEIWNPVEDDKKIYRQYITMKYIDLGLYSAISYSRKLFVTSFDIGDIIYGKLVNTYVCDFSRIPKYIYFLLGVAQKSQSRIHHSNAEL